MKIKKHIIKKINNRPSMQRLALALNVGERAMQVQIEQNNFNGRLTKMDALRAISAETGEIIENILETEPEKIK